MSGLRSLEPLGWAASTASQQGVDQRSLAMENVPKYGVNAYSTPHNSVYDDIEQVARTGGGGVGLFEGKFVDGQDAKVRDAMAQRGLKALYCVPRSHSILGIPFGPSSRKMPLWKRVEEICASVARLSAFDPVVIAVAPGTTGDPAHPAGPVEDVVAALPVIADTAAEYGQQVGLELLAERRGSPLNTLPDMVALIDELARPNVGVLFDGLHRWCEPELHVHTRTSAGRLNSRPACDGKQQDRIGGTLQPGQGGYCVAVGRRIAAGLSERSWVSAPSEYRFRPVIAAWLKKIVRTAEPGVRSRMRLAPTAFNRFRRLPNRRGAPEL